MGAVSDTVGASWGKALVIDVGARTSHEEPVEAQVIRDFIGGRGLAAHYLFHHLRPGADPLGPDNPLVFAAGPLVGTSAPGGARAALATKSPQTGIYLFSITGGRLGPAIKRSGFDLIVLTGSSETPVYVEVDNGRAYIRDAGELWGLDTQATQELLHADLRGQEAAITCIGQAGERLVPSANLINERRALGRGGAGAVMGSKKVKALVVRPGPEAPAIADLPAFREAARAASRQLRANPFTSGPLRTFGSVSTVAVAAHAGILPADNWQRPAPVELAQQVMGDTLKERFLARDTPCGDPCPIKCSKITVVSEGPYAGAMTEGPEYETIYALGTACGIYDLAPIIQADSMCDLYGIDTISIGVTIAFAMECYQRGLLTRDDTGGLDLTFGNEAAVLQLIRDASFRQGFGERIARGSRALAEEIGQGSEAFAMHAKGMELGGYDPRGVKGMATVYACGPRGGCHHAGGYTVAAELANPNIDRYAEKGKAPLTLGSRNRRAGFADAAGTCAFLIVGMEDDTLAELISAALGTQLSAADLYKAGERINALERVINVREGIRGAHDTLPARLTGEPLPSGPAQGQTVDLVTARAELYQQSGLDAETSLPTRETLDRLGLGWVAEDPAVSALL
ncbi:MAG: aldehyde ferredoxin oxidoreductase family protein [Thermoleophilia bacterium]|nr:aldehyde ferredoxin oxidoreductase family protein [Thermoleophilia bacterium]